MPSASTRLRSGAVRLSAAVRLAPMNSATVTTTSEGELGLGRKDPTQDSLSGRARRTTAHREGREPLRRRSAVARPAPRRRRSRGHADGGQKVASANARVPGPMGVVPGQRARASRTVPRRGSPREVPRWGHRRRTGEVTLERLPPVPRRRARPGAGGVRQDVRAPQGTRRHPPGSSPSGTGCPRAPSCHRGHPCAAGPGRSEGLYQARLPPRAR